METHTGSKSFRDRWDTIHPARRGLVLAWLSFTTTFIVARIVTGVIKIGDQNTGNLSAGGLHLHHYLWGILIVAAVAVFGLVDRSANARSWMGAALGVGLALVIDEAALLVTLKDVYWSSAGWTSVAAAISIIGVVGSALTITRSRRGGG